jgi:hypothetical protein
MRLTAGMLRTRLGVETARKLSYLQRQYGRDADFSAVCEEDDF